MKNIPLNMITENINGKLIRGDGNILINDMVLRNNGLKQGAVLFDVYREQKLEPELFSLKKCAVVTDTPEKFERLPESIAIISVESISRAYWHFVSFYRGLFDIPVIGVTGTCGKTTTKEMIKHILSKKYKVNATYKSFNADFRHLSYLLEIDDSTQAGVYEMGVAAPGDLKRCCRYFKPQVGVITNIGVDHLLSFNTHDDYIKGKAEFLEGLGYTGTLVLNADNENIKKINLTPFKGRILYFGFDKNADFRIWDVHQKEESLEFLLSFNETVYKVILPGYARFNAYNAAAAIAAVYASGGDIKEACEALKDFKNVEKHFEVNKGINGSIIIDDTWSTNPTSAEEALRLLKKMSNGKKTVAALGRMSLLGSQSSEYHFKLGKRVAELNIDYLILLGEGASEIGLGALNYGMKKENIIMCRRFESTYKAFERLLDSNTMVLVKTSMMASFADLVERITLKSMNDI